MGRLVFAELFKLRRRQMTQVLAVLVVVFFGLIQLARWNATDTEVVVTEARPVVTDEELARFENHRLEASTRQAAPERQREQFLADMIPDNIEIARWVGILFGVMLVSAALGSEYTWGTLRPFLTCVESRRKYLGAKFVALGILILLGLVVALAIAAVSSLLIASARGGVELGFLDGAYARDALFDFGRSAFAITPYLLVAGLATIVGRSAMIGAVSGLGVLLAESVATPFMERADNWTEHIPDFLLSRNVNALLDVVSEDVAQRDPWLAGAVLGAYAIGALALALYVFERRDVTS